jgi:hypothetical protein
MIVALLQTSLDWRSDAGIGSLLLYRLIPRDLLSRTTFLLNLPTLEMNSVWTSLCREPYMISFAFVQKLYVNLC